jgi:predicted ArsR family transcriptional regulator
MPVTASRTVIDSVALLIVELQREPSTAMDVAARLGTKEETVRGHMAVLAARDLIEPAGVQWRQRGVKPIVWRWRRV